MVGTRDLLGDREGERAKGLLGVRHRETERTGKREGTATDHTFKGVHVTALTVTCTWRQGTPLAAKAGWRESTLLAAEQSLQHPVPLVS